jgi:hypothetical protein
MPHAANQLPIVSEPSTIDHVIVVNQKEPGA